MDKVIVTGANGFIGTALLRLLNKSKVKVYAIIKDEFENIDQIKDFENVEIVYCALENIYRIKDLIADKGIDTIIHLAWMGSFGTARADYNLQLKNVKYALDTICVAKELGIRRFVGVGSLAEKDILSYHLLDGATPNDVSIYGIAKLSMNLMTKALCNNFGMEHVWCCLSNTYGIGNTTNNFVNMVSKKMFLGERAAFSEGTQIYDFVYVTDTVQGIFCAAEKGRKNHSYYLGSGEARPLREYIFMIRDAIDHNIPIYLGELPFNGKSLTMETYSIQKEREEIGYHPEVCFEEGIRETIAWLRREIDAKI